MFCRGCEHDLPQDAFYKHSAAASGFMAICRACHKQRVRIRARTNPAVQEYDRTRAKAPARKQHIRRVTKEWREENPAAYRAHTAVSNAVRDKRLSKEPCVICGETKVHAHHKDYSKPLDVVWLCARCHHRLHANFPELEGRAKA